MFRGFELKKRDSAFLWSYLLAFCFILELISRSNLLLTPTPPTKKTDLFVHALQTLLKLPTFQEGLKFCVVQVVSVV